MTHSRAQAAALPPIVREVLASPGRALHTAEREPVASRMGHDFSGVRLHADERAADSARSIGAEAYTFGRHVVFGEGKFQPGSSGGQRLLAHELAHVVQQEESGGGGGAPSRIDEPQDGSESWATDSSRGAPGRAAAAAPNVAPGTVQRQKDPAADASGEPGGAASPGAAAPGGWSVADTRIAFDISHQVAREASLYMAGGPAATVPGAGGAQAGGIGSWSNEKVFSIDPGERTWLHTAYWVDTKGHPLPPQYAKFSVTNDIRFAPVSGEGVSRHFEDGNPQYRGPGSALNPTLGATRPGASDLPVMELPLNGGGTLSWSAAINFPGFQKSYSVGGTFQLKTNSPAAPQPVAAPAATGPAKAPGGVSAAQPAPKGTPLPASPPPAKAPPHLAGEIEALTELIRKTTDAVKRDEAVRKLRDKLAEAQPFLPPGEARKLIDQAIESAVTSGVKTGMMKLLEALAGKSATTVPSKENQTGPSGPPIPEKDLKTQIIKGPEIPWDVGGKPAPVLSVRYQNGFRNSYTIEEPMKFTIVLPDYIKNASPAGRLSIIAASEAKMPNVSKRWAMKNLANSTSQEIYMVAPSEPGKYVLRVDIGMGFDDSSIQEFEVVAKKK